MSDWIFKPVFDKSKQPKNSFDYLCEYYDVDLQQAVQLGTRSSGRKPSLPGSKTCKPVSDKTLEDIWSLKERTTSKDIFDFYVDQGAWSSFRQTVRHVELEPLHKWIQAQFFKPGMHILEYGCGVAPFVTSLLLGAPKDNKYDISISDVDGAEHFLFAGWKLNRIVEDRDLRGVTVSACPVKHDGLPKYHKEVDLAINFEVMEHVPSPVDVINNLMAQMSPGALYIENFIKHEREDEHDDLGPDLTSAAAERDDYYNVIQENFQLLGGELPEVNPNQTRIWKKNM